MKITKRRLRRIIKEEKTKILNEQRVRRIVRRRLSEYGSSFGDASWSETDDGVRFDVEGHGEGLTESEVYDIMNDPNTDDKLSSDIRAAVEDADEYDGGY